VGVDLGISRLATISDGTFIENPRPLRKNLKKLSRMSKLMSRRKKGGANWHKVVSRAANLYLHVSNVRNNVLHHATTYLAKTKSVIVLEDLNVRGMMSNHSLAQSIADAGWFEFRQQLAYKSDWYGSSIVLADRFFPSTKRCSNCGALKSDVSLDERIYQCDYCGIVIDRDLNAAKNLEQLITASSAGL
jgi:putative transposase